MKAFCLTLSDGQYGIGIAIRSMGEDVTFGRI